jgi:glycosyltransferase involved in cell wall biosynthesis
MSGSTRSYEMARRLVLLGHQVELITSTRGVYRCQSELVSIESGINVHWIKNKYSNKMNFYSRIYSFVHFALLSFWKASKLKGDLIFASSTPLTVSIPGILAARIKGIPFYFEVRDLWPDVPIAMGYLKNPIFRFLALKLEKFSYQNSEGIIALSEGMKDGIVKTGYPSSKIILIPNGADLDLFDYRKTDKENVRLKYGFDKNDFIILYPGTFGKVNNLEYLVELAGMFRNGNSVKFVLVGDGKEKSKVISMAQNLNLLDNIVFVFNQIPKKDIPDLFSMSDIVISTILPIKELEANSANKYFDALASGTCIVINHGGWQEKEVIEYNCGFRVSQNLEEAYKKLLEYIDNRPLVVQMGLNARKLAEKKYSRDFLANEMALFFENY